ncbi:reverse transcriptase domain-containing protein [Tanacetum coccineum]
MSHLLPIYYHYHHPSYSPAPDQLHHHQGHHRPEVTLPPRKRLCIALGPAYEVKESLSTAAARPAGGIGVHMHVLLDSWRLRLGYLERLGDDLWMRVILCVQRDAGGRSQEAEAAHRGAKADKETLDLDGRKMAPKRRTTRLNPETTPAVTAATTTTVTNAQLQAMINQGVTATLAARDANTNGVDSHNSGTGARRNETVGNDIAYAMTWTELKKKITNKYCPRTEIKKLKVKLMFPEESDKIEKYVSGLPDMIHRSVVTSKPKTMQEATEMAIEVMDKRIRTFADRQTENKRKPDNNQQPQQHHQNKRQNTGRAYAAWTVEKKQYRGSKPLCSKCNYHHDGPCSPKCYKCNKVGHFARDCRSTTNANNANHQRGTGSGQNPACFEYGAQGHFKRECPKLKNNNNRGNQVRGGNASAKVYAIGHAGTNPDSNVVTSTFLLNNRYASILFDTGADRSFVSTAFSSQIDIPPTALDHYYHVELADGRIIGLNTIFSSFLSFWNPYEM